MFVSRYSRRIKPGKPTPGQSEPPMKTPTALVPSNGHAVQPAPSLRLPDLPPVHETGTRYAIEPRIVMKQSIQQSPTRIARTRMNDEACRLIDDDDFVILEDDV